MYDLYHISISMLHQIGEEHCIAGHDQEASTSCGPSIRPPVSSTPIRMQPIRGRGKERVDRRGCDRDGVRVAEMVDKVMVEMVMEVVVHLSQHCHHYHPLPYLHPILRCAPILTHHLILSYILPYAPILTHHPLLLYPNILTHQLP